MWAACQRTPGLLPLIQEEPNSTQAWLFVPYYVDVILQPDSRRAIVVSSMPTVSFGSTRPSIWERSRWPTSR
jgi:hypothetical protein